jgi:hypothetical protein
VAGGCNQFYGNAQHAAACALHNSYLEDKYTIAKHTSSANYSFLMGTSNDNMMK